MSLNRTLADPVVFDAEPLVAYLRDESGSDRVEEYLHAMSTGHVKVYISPVTLTEGKYICDRHLPRDTINEYINQLLENGLHGIGGEYAWEVAASVKNEMNIPLGDAYVIASAAAIETHHPTVLTGADNDFEDLSGIKQDTQRNLSIERFRVEPA